MYSLAVHQRVDAGGVGLHVAEAGEGHPLVFLHGLGWTHALWAPAFDRYAARYRVIAGDTRGHGQSDKPPGPYSITQFAKDWLATLEALDAGNAIVVGFSQGGMIAQQMALDSPSRFRGLFLACTACRSSAASASNMELRIKAMLEGGAAASARIAVRSIFSETFIDQNPAVVEQFVRCRALSDQDALIASMRATNGFDLQADLPSLRLPSQVVCASQDTLTPPARVAEVAQGLGVSMRIVEGAGHMVQVEQAEAFYAFLDEFLEAL